MQSESFESSTSTTDGNEAVRDGTVTLNCSWTAAASPSATGHGLVPGKPPLSVGGEGIFSTLRRERIPRRISLLAFDAMSALTSQAGLLLKQEGNLALVASMCWLTFPRSLSRTRLSTGFSAPIPFTMLTQKNRQPQ